jgi:hypothetical protein
VKKFIACWLVLLFAFAFIPGKGWAEGNPLLVKAVSKPDYIRLFFYCQQPVNFKPVLKNNVLQVSFDKAFEVNFGNVREVLADNLSGMQISNDGKTASFTLNGSNYGYRKFIGEKFVGVDIIKKAPEVKSAANKTLPAEKPKKIELAQREPEVKLMPVPVARPAQVAQNQEIEPVILKQKFEQTAISGVENATEVDPKAVVGDVQVEEKKPEQTETLPPKLDEKVNELIEGKEPAAQEQSTAQQPAEPKVPLDTKRLNLKTKISFSWDGPVSASVFSRGEYLWVIFDKFKAVDVAKIVNDNKSLFNDAQQIENKSYTILHFKLADKANFIAYKEENDWVLGQTEAKFLPDQEPSLKVSATELQGSKITVGSVDKLNPLRFIDPVVGDEMIVLPYLSATGFTQKRSYTDFSLLKTIQGGAINLTSDNVNVDVISKGVEIAGPTNKLAGSAQSALRELQEKEKAAKLRSEKLKQSGGDLTVIKFNTWKLGGDRSYEKDLQDLEWKITEVNWSEKSEPRLNLARFYLAHGLYPEAIGVIGVLKESDEVFGNTNDVKIIEATVLYLSGRYQEAMDIYDTVNYSSLDDSGKQEIKFWRIASALQLGNQIKIDKFMAPEIEDKKDEAETGDEAENTKLMLDTSSRLLKIIRKMDPEFVNADEIQKLESTARFVTNHYQEAIKRFEESDLYKQGGLGGDAFSTEDDKLWWSTADQKRVDKADLPFTESIDVFLKYYPNTIFNDFALLALENRLKKNDLVVSEEILSSFKEEERSQAKNSIEFLRGLFYAKDEEDAKAVATWQPITEDVFDRYNRTRAEFALTTFQIKKKEIDEKAAIDRLNKVRILWRGGILEFQVLNTLGEYYMQQKQYMDGFKVWRSAISAFPGSDEALLIAKKMSDKFVQVFSQGGADEIPKLDALTLYYEFRELTPIGKLGDEMISRLADRLIEVDLLDRAAALLTHQVRFRLIGDEKDAAVLKLVKVHLMNHQPQDAYDVLNATYRENILPETLQERKYLESTALVELGQSNKVLAVLKGDDSHKASFLRADVYWRNKVWKKVVDELETPFRDIRREEKALTIEETDQLLRLAVAYALTDKKKRLQILYEDFVDFVTDEERKKVFMFVSTDKGPVDSKNLEATLELNDMKDFLSKYMEAGSEKVVATGASAN